jgi:hypothetical protein
MGVPILFHLFRGYNDDIDRLSNANEIHVDIADELSSIKAAFLHYQQVQVAVGASLRAPPIRTG